MTARVRTAVLPIAAAVLVGGVLGVQVGSGGGRFTPLRPADPCAVRIVTSVSSGIEGLTERLVVLGLDGAACRLRTSREELLLDLARPGPRSDAQVSALRAGLLEAVRRLDAAGTLPRASGLTDDVVDASDLNPFLKAALRALPDSLVDAVLKTDDVLRRTVQDLDLRGLLAHLDDPDDLQHRVSAAVTTAVRQSLLARLRDLL